MTGRPRRKRTDPPYWIPACTNHACVAGQWASDEELTKGLEDLRGFLAAVERDPDDDRARFAASYLAHRIARAHLVRTGRNLYDVRGTFHYETEEAPAIFRASWPWDFDGAEEVGRTVLESPAWSSYMAADFSPIGGMPF